MKLFYTVILVLFCYVPVNSPVLASEWKVIVGGNDFATDLSNLDAGATNPADKSKGVGLVVVTIPEKGAIPIGTAWLCQKGVLATNAHVAMGAANVLKFAKKKGIAGSIAYYLPNHSKGKAVQITKMALHPEYQRVPVNVNGTRPVNSPDVALMALKETLSPALPIAGTRVLENLKPGDSIQYIGFPMENLIGGNVNLHDVMATTQSGTITAVSDWWLGDSGQKANKLIRHDIGVTGGASGSPIFNKSGVVVGLVNAGNMVGSVSFDQNGKLKIIRTPNAAMVNFGIRVDLLDDIQL